MINVDVLSLKRCNSLMSTRGQCFSLVSFFLLKKKKKKFLCFASISKYLVVIESEVDKYLIIMKCGALEVHWCLRA